MVYFKRITALATRICELKLKAGDTPEEIQEAMKGKYVDVVYHHDIESPSHLEIAIARSELKLEEYLFHIVDDVATHQDWSNGNCVERPATEKERFVAISRVLQHGYKQVMKQLLEQ